MSIITSYRTPNTPIEGDCSFGSHPNGKPLCLVGIAARAFGQGANTVRLMILATTSQIRRAPNNDANTVRTMGGGNG